MSLHNPEYPNLPLIEYMFELALMSDENWEGKYFSKQKGNKYTHSHVHPDPEFLVTVFPQVWGSTCTAFDVCPDGSPTIGGAAMTTAYTTVIREPNTEYYGIYIGNRLCYVVDNPTNEFYEDLKNQNMASLSVAEKRY